MPVPPAAFPGGLDALANPTGTTNRDDDGFELDLVVSRIHDILEALEAKVGITASLPAAGGGVLRQTGTGASTWGKVQSADIQDGSIAVGDMLAGGSGTVMGTAYGGTSISHRQPPTPAIHLQFAFDSSTTVAEPAAGRWRLNNATPASATILMLGASDLHGYNTPGVLGLLTNGAFPATRGLVRMQHGTNWGTQLSARITSITALGSGIQIGLATSPIALGTFANTDLTEITIEPGGFDNPMTTQHDMIYAEAGGQAFRLGKGAASTVLGVSAANAFGYRQITTADLVANTVHQYVNGNLTGAQTLTGTTSPTAMTGTVSITTTGGFCLAMLSGALSVNTATGFAAIAITVDGTSLGELAATTSATAGAYVAFGISQVTFPTAASHTFGAQWRIGTASHTVTLNTATLTVIEFKR